jgi:chromosomal replication initiation ATPase DnaA
MASNMLISRSGFKLEDLLSRLQGISSTTIQHPDDKLLRAVLLKAFMDRQLSPAPSVFAYILKNISRSFDAIFEIVEKLDTKSLTEKRPISRGMVASILRGSID